MTHNHPCKGMGGCIDLSMPCWLLQFCLFPLSLSSFPLPILLGIVIVKKKNGTEGWNNGRGGEIFCVMLGKL